ncbi:MAG: hypothetical protein OXF61_16375 [Acidimicrobiaceae bacterium]|nr:hypothetical protein [Acidimicrobiaceae bacterium]
MGELEGLERVMVLSVDDDVSRLACTTVDRTETSEARIDCLPEVRDDHELGDVDILG